MINMRDDAKIANLGRVSQRRLRCLGKWYRWHGLGLAPGAANYLAEVLLAAFAIADFLFAAALAWMTPFETATSSALEAARSS